VGVVGGVGLIHGSGRVAKGGQRAKLSRGQR
jgi:hypothetical protein